MAQAAAIAVLGDSVFLQQSYDMNKAGKKTLAEAFTRLNLPYVPSFANFVLVRVGDADRVNLELLRRGVIVRPVGGDGLPEWLRISIGLPKENTQFIDALTDILSGS
jgi:histidinol-phosphate aminotransferase